MLHLQILVLQNPPEFWRKTCWSAEESFASSAPPQPPQAGLLHFTPAEHGLCEQEVDYEKTEESLKTAKFSTTGI